MTEPANGIPQHLIIPHSLGRIMSNVTGENVQYGAVCDPKLPLPNRADPKSHSFTDEPRCVTCDKCKATPEFAQRYLEVVGEEYEPPKVEGQN